MEKPIASPDAEHAVTVEALVAGLEAIMAEEPLTDFVARITKRCKRDEDCTVGGDGCCVRCGVSHTGSCRSCGAHGYHRAGCAESDDGEGVRP